MKLVFRKHFGSLRPADQASEAALAKIKGGDLVMVDLRRPRSIQQHRLLFAVLNLVVENTERYQTVEHLLDALKIATGHCTRYPSVDGSIVFVKPNSISFESMPREEFEPFFDRCLDLIVTKIIPGLDKPALLAEVNEMLGVPVAA